MSEFEEGGQEVWDAFQAQSLDGALQALVRELARTVDTLDKLDGLVRAKQDSWAVLVFDDMGTVHLSIDKLLEARAKQQSIFKQLWTELRGWGVKPQASKASTGVVTDEEPEDVLAKRRREREERERKLG